MRATPFCPVILLAILPVTWSEGSSGSDGAHKVPYLKDLGGNPSDRLDGRTKEDNIYMVDGRDGAALGDTIIGPYSW